ncbi:SH3 domain-containing protein [Albidovulum sp.]|uniref:SH3 domain-containing protein n=1 Tax=Albidovulum sp. TaxID=1872424 RepID=UPI0039B94106
MFRSLAAAGVAAVFVTSGAASAPDSAATTDLNLRSGPGPNYAVAGVIPAGTAVDVAGCLEAANWCQVVYNGQTGWSYGD